MKRSMLLATAMVALTLATPARAQTPPAGQVDFGKFSPPKSGAEFVEVNISSGLLSMASRLVPKDEPEVAKLLGGLQRIHVNVVGLDDDNRADIEKRAKKIRSELETQGWERIVTAQKDNQDVGVYIKTHGTNAIAGLTLVVMEGKKQQAVFINIVGDIKPEQIAQVGERLNIDPLKELGREPRKEKEEKKS
jgi:hypothetical protein